MAGIDQPDPATVFCQWFPDESCKDTVKVIGRESRNSGKVIQGRLPIRIIPNESNNHIDSISILQFAQVDLEVTGFSLISTHECVISPDVQGCYSNLAMFPN